MNIILDKIKAIAIYRVFFVKSAWELAVDKDDVKKPRTKGNAFFSLSAVRSIGESLGFHFSEFEVMPAGIDLINPVSHFQRNCFEADTLAQDIETSYGLSARKTFEISQYIAIVFQISSLFTAFPDSEYDQFLITLTNETQVLFQKFTSFYKSSLGTLFPNEKTLSLFNQLFIQIEKDGEEIQDYYAKTASLAVEIVNDFVPAFSEMGNRAVRAAQLMSRLRTCSPGRNQWAEYENICIEILKFLFVPPFRTVFTQARTTGGYERRDAVLPNNQYDGFWGAIRQEFEAKHIVCEFKNIKTKLDKSLLNQLRIYLSKPTVGRFGLLFIRAEPNNVLLKAQRDAYEQAKILILIINDEIINDLMMARVYLGSVETILENEKIRFEIEY